MKHRVHVECYSGSRYAERPVTFEFLGQTHMVKAVVQTWRSPSAFHYRLRTEEDESFELTYYEGTDEWVIHSPDAIASESKERESVREVLARRIGAVPPSGIRKFFDIIATMDDVISLGVGEPDFDTPAHITQAGIRSLEGGETSYTSNAGILELRDELSKHLSRLYGVNYDPAEELLISVGVSEALFLALLAVVDPGDEVIVPEPCFVSYRPGLIFAGGTPVTVEAKVENQFQITADDIEEKITPKTKALLIGYPNNPTGAVMSRERLGEIGALAEKHDLIVLSDEIYDRLVYGVEHVCFSSLPNMRDRTILLSGFSKTYAMTGWRLGYAAAPAEILAGMQKAHQYIIMCAPTTAQVAGVEALRHGEDAVQEMLREYDQRRRVIVDGLNTVGLPCVEPKGAFYAFPSIQNTSLSSEEFSEKLLYEQKVAVVPGTAFGESGEGFVRCAYATSLVEIEEALGRMEDFVKQHRK